MIMFNKFVEIDVTIGNRKISKNEIREMNRCKDILGRTKEGKQVFLKYLRENAYPVNQDCTAIDFEDISSFDNFINNCRRAMDEL